MGSCLQILSRSEPPLEGICFGSLGTHFVAFVAQRTCTDSVALGVSGCVACLVRALTTSPATSWSRETEVGR